jgi:hypothetical protein
MSELLTIPGLDQPFLELLEAAGFHDFKDLAESDEEELALELERANRILKIAGSAPCQDTVAAWVRHAREQTGVTEEEPVLVAVDYEKNAKVLVMLRSSPLAIPLPGNALKDKGLTVQDIPSGLLLNEYPGDLDTRVEKRIPMARTDGPSHAPYVQVSDKFGESKLDIDVSRLKSMSDMGPGLPRVHAAPPPEEEDRVGLIRAPKASTNEGRDANSRRFIRGILHSHPGGMYAGAILTLALMVIGPAAVAAAFLLLLSREMPETFGWVEAWWLAFPIALPVLALAWAVWGLSGKCRVCGQTLFLHRAHRKNAKAHYVPWLGYVLPLCVHILLFHWFRCSHCGTPVRLKK